MVKRVNSELRQLELNVSVEQCTQAMQQDVHSVRCVGFIDAKTRAIREEAVNRVRSAGIFSVKEPSSKR